MHVRFASWGSRVKGRKGISVSVSALHTISSATSLATAFSKLKKKKSRRLHVRGVDGVSLLQFSEYQKEYIKEASLSLKKGEYQPKDLLAFFIPKEGDGGYRVIGIPSTIDRVVQLSILEFISGSGFKFRSNNNYGFIKHGGVKKALQRVAVERAKNNYAVKVDIDSFFDSIPRPLLKEKVKSRIRHSSIHALMSKYIDCEMKINEKDRNIQNNLGFIEGHGVRQGMPLSPFFANLFLDDFDLALERNGLKFVRYADDIICFGKNAGIAEWAPKIISEELDRIGLRLKDKKTKYAVAEESIEFLGLDSALVNGRYCSVVSEAKLDSMKQEIMRFSDFSVCEQNMMTLPQVYRKIQGMIDGYYGFYEDCANAQEAEMKLEHATHECIKRLLTSVFGVNVNDLRKNKLVFLGLR